MRLLAQKRVQPFHVGAIDGRVKSARIIENAISPQLFDGLDADELSSILQAAKERHSPANAVVLHQTERAEQMLLLLEGRARHFFVTQNGDRILLRWLVPGDITGGRTLLARPVNYFVSTETLKECRFLVWDSPTLSRLTTTYPRFLRNVLFIADEYLEWFLTAHLALSSFTARQRCASILKSVALTVGHRVAKGIALDITNEELADASAITLFEASRFVSEWHRSGIIVKKRGTILVRSLDLLTREIRKSR